MKILVLLDGKSAVETWRIERPIRELKKHVDWQIDTQKRVVRDYHGIDDPDEFMEKYGTAEAKHLGQYDVIFASYSHFLSPHSFAMVWGANKKYGTKLIIDVDDDIFDVDPSNFQFWNAAKRAGHAFLTTSIELADTICTTNQRLADKIQAHAAGKQDIHIINNYMAEDYPDQSVDNGDKIVIGYFGSSSHYNDVHKSGLLPGLQRVMHDHKNVYVKTCGLPLDYYLPKARVELVDLAPSSEWIDRLASLNLDISVGPLLDTEFNKHKSEIKWMESTRMGSAFVCTDSPTFASVETAIKVKNDGNEWYKALEKLVVDAELRKSYVAKSKEKLKSLMLEDNYTKYVDMFTKVSK